MKSIIYALVFCLSISQLIAQQITNGLQNFENRNSLWLKFPLSEQVNSSVLEKNDTIFKLKKGNYLKKINTIIDKLGVQHHRYQQKYNDIPVEGATVIMHEKNDLVTHANGKIVSDISIDINPSISEEVALYLALNNFKASIYAWTDPTYEKILKDITGDTGATHYPSGELVIAKSDSHESLSKYQLAYKFTIYAIEPLTIKTVYVNAHGGEIIKSEEKLHSCTNYVSVENIESGYSDEFDLTVCYENSEYTLHLDTNGVEIKVFDAANSENFDTENLVTDADGNFEMNLAAIDAFWATSEFNSFLKAQFNRNSIDGNYAPLYSWVRYGEQLNNAYWNGNWMIYGDGDGVYFNSLTTPDIVGHEITHGIIDYTANLKYEFESGALNESFADIFAKIFEYYVKQKHSNDTIDLWLVGKDCVMADGKTCLRNMSNPNDLNALNRQPDTYQGYNWYTGGNDFGGVHQNSGVQNYWFYLLADGGSGINDNGIEYHLNGIGIEKTAEIVYLNLTAYLTEEAQYSDARKGSIQAAIDLFGENSNEVLQTEAAWSAVGVGPQFGINNCNRLTDSLALVELYNTTNGNTWNTTWNLNQSMENWYGVHLNLYGCVSCLDLDGLDDCANTYSLLGNNLTGSIPSQLGNLSNIIFLDLNSNDFVGTSVPVEIGNLTHLIYLDLDTTQLEGIIPPELGNLINLEHLDIDRNNLGGEIPSQLGNLKKLTELDLDRNELTGSIPSEFANLTNLTQLDLRYNNLTGCYHPDLISLCDQLISSGTYINYDNDFDALWDIFCETNTGECSCRKIDSLALVGLFNTTDGENWTNKTNWLQSSLNTWFGVTLNAEGCVTKLDLSNNQLSGSLPAKIAEITSLNELILPYNQLTGNIPVEISELNELTILDLGWNQLAGKIPEDLSNLTNLQGLFLGWNDFTGNIPAELSNLNNLLYLWLNENDLTGNIPKELSSLTQLEDLILFSNNLSGCYNAKLANFCEQLNPTFNNNFHISDDNNFDANWEDFCNTSIGMCTCRQIDSLALVALYNSTNGDNWTVKTNWLEDGQPLETWHGVDTNTDGCVTCIDLDGLFDCSDTYSNTGNNLTGYIPKEIGNLDSLTFLDLSFNNIDGNIPSSIGNLSKLTYLDLDENNLTGSIPPELGNLINLEILDIDHNQLSGFIPSEIGYLNNLEEIDFDYNQLIGRIPSSFGDMLSLTQLDLRYNKMNGCYPQNLLNLCTQLNSSAAYITTGNNFMNSWTDFCDELVGNCSAIPVYPGDFNNDGIANVFDLPYWGVAYGKMGPERNDANTNWEPQLCDDWPDEVNGINGKHQDADGSGEVNDDDVLVFENNYYETWSNSLASSSNSPLVFWLEYVGIFNDSIQFDLVVKSQFGNNETLNLHGIAYIIDLSEFYIAGAVLDEDDIGLDISNSSLQPSDYILKCENNQLSIGFTRVDHVNQTCNDPLARISMPVADIKSDEPPVFRFYEGSVMRADGNNIPINGSQQISMLPDSTSIIGDFMASVLVSFNPCSNGGVATVIHSNEDNYTYEWDNGDTTKSITNLPVGSHEVILTKNQEPGKTIEFEVQWAFTPLEITANNNQICINFENAPLPGEVQVSLNNGADYENSITSDTCYTKPAGTYHLWIKREGEECPVDLGEINIEAEDECSVNVSFTGLPASTFSSSPIYLTGSPVGGEFSGTAVLFSVFNPLLAGPGFHEVTYTYTDSNGCSDSTTQSILVFSVNFNFVNYNLGIITPKIIDLPTVDENIELTQENDTYTFEIINIEGRILHQKVLKIKSLMYTPDLEMPTLKNGTYIARFYNSYEQVSKKIVVSQ